MIRNIFTLVLHDFAMLFSNKSIFLILFVPLFVVISFKLADRPDVPFKKVKIGLIQNEIYSTAFMNSVAAADTVFTISRVSLEEGMQRLKDRKLDGILTNYSKEPEGLTLLVLRKESFQTATIVESLAALHNATTGTGKGWIAAIKPLQTGGVQKQMLPAWVLMVVLLVSCIIIPTQVAEEKEKKLLLGLLQTPMHETEWLLARLVSGLILINIALIILHFPAGFDPITKPGYILFLEVGSFCFCSFGILLGFLCRTQASARTAGIMFYIPLLIPSALSDFSLKLNKVAFFVPSNRLYNPLKSILLDNSGLSIFYREFIFLLLFGVFAFVFSYTLMKRRWLM